MQIWWWDLHSKFWTRIKLYDYCLTSFRRTWFVTLVRFSRHSVRRYAHLLATNSAFPLLITNGGQATLFSDNTFFLFQRRAKCAGCNLCKLVVTRENRWFSPLKDAKGNAVVPEQRSPGSHRWTSGKFGVRKLWFDEKTNEVVDSTATPNSSV